MGLGMEVLYTIAIFVAMSGVFWPIVYGLVVYTTIFFDQVHKTDRDLDDVFSLFHHVVLFFGIFVLPLAIRYCCGESKSRRTSKTIRKAIAAIFMLVSQGYLAVNSARAALLYQNMSKTYCWTTLLFANVELCRLHELYYLVRFGMDIYAALFGGICTFLLPVTYFTFLEEKRPLRQMDRKEIRSISRSTPLKTPADLILEQCPVCMDLPVTVTLNCNHAFCEACVGKMGPILLCPICRQPITNEKRLQLTTII